MSNPPYRFGVSEFTTMPWSFEQDVEAYVALGVDCIEICEFKLDPDMGRAADQLAMARDKGLTISSVQPFVHALYPDPPRPEPVDPAERMKRYRQSIDLFGKAAPGSTLVTIAGPAPKGNYREAYETARKEYPLLATYAADHGVRIALEPLNPILMNTDTFVCTLPDALRIVEEIDNPNMGIFLDVYHVWQDPAVNEHIAACAGKIFGVHVNDWHTPRDRGDRAIIGQGEIPMASLLRAVRRTGYDGAYTLELFSEEWLPDSLLKRDMREVIAECREGLDRAWAAGE